MPLDRADWATLADLNIAFIELTLDLLGIQTQTLRSSELGSSAAGRRGSQTC